MALNLDCKAVPYLTGRAIAIVERFAAPHFGPRTLQNMFSLPQYYIGVFARYVPADNPDWPDLFASLPKRLLPMEQAQAWIGYYHQKAELDKTDQRSAIGSRIAALRQEQGLTLTQLAEMAGIDRANLNKIELGKYNVSVDILNRICLALGVEIQIG